MFFKNWKFFKAIKKGNIKEVTVFLETDPHLSKKSKALYYASKAGHLEIVKLLLKNGANVNAQYSQYYCVTALDIAIENRHYEVVKLLLENGATLSYESKKGDLETVKLLLKTRANVNAQDELSLTALHYASKNGHLEAVKLLLENGANPNIQANPCKQGYPDDEFSDQIGTALIFASSKGHLEIVKLLLENGADVNAKEEGEDLTALHLASFEGHLEIVKLLLENGADVNAQDKNGKTALYYARRENHFGVENHLIKNQAKGPWGATLKKKGIRGILKKILIIIAKVILIIVLSLVVFWLMATCNGIKL